MLWSHVAFIEIYGNFRAYFIETILRGKKFHKPQYGFSFLGGSFSLFHYQEKLYLGSVTVVNCAISLREKCPYSEFLCSLHRCIRNKYGAEKTLFTRRYSKINNSYIPTCNFYTITCRFSYKDRAIMKFAYLTDTEGIDKNDRNHEW